MHNADDLVTWLGDIDGHVGRHIDRLGLRRKWCRSENMEGRISKLEKELCVKYMAKERGKKEGDIQTGKNEIEVTFVLIGKHQQFVQNVKAIPVVFQHALLVADIDEI